MDILNLDETDIPSEEDFLRQAGLTDKEIAVFVYGRQQYLSRV
jgi:hypothetical protein